MIDFFPPGNFVENDSDEDEELFENLEQSDLIEVQPIIMDESQSSSDEVFSPEHDVDDDSDFLAESSSEDEILTTVVIEKDRASVTSENTRVIDDYDPNDEADDIVKKILTELKKPRLKPPKIVVEDFPTDLSFHPEREILVIGTITGDLLVYKYSNDENKLLYTHEAHTKAIRDIEFSTDGRDVFSGSRDKSIVVTDFETGKLKRFWDKSHEHPIYTLTVIDENLVASGDDEGTVKLWDVRIKGNDPIFSLREVEDYVSCIITNNQKRTLVVTSGDGFLTSFNIGQKKMFVQSEPYEEELTCAGIYRNESKVVVGSSKGNFYTFNWGEFGYHCDAFSIPLSPISLMIPITERIAVTAGEEGILKAVHLVPGRILGVVGQHPLAVEAMDICGNGEFIASSSHDNDIQFWNIKYFEDFDAINYNEKPTKKAGKHNLPSSLLANRSDFFADLA